MLGFEDVAESFITPQERKDAKRSDPGAAASDKTRYTVSSNSNNSNQLREEKRTSKNSTVKAAPSKSSSLNEQQQHQQERGGYEVDLEDDTAQGAEQRSIDGIDEEEQRQQEQEDEKQRRREEDNEQSGSQKKDNLKKYSTTFSQQPAAGGTAPTAAASEQRKVSTTTVTRVESKSGHKSSKQSFDKTLLIPQERYKSTLPKIIITASASVSANGKKLNYSLGNVLGQGAELKIPPPTYDDYKEEDVVLDPFFQDVPKIKKH